MKLDYLENGSPDCPLLRLYDFTSAQALLLHEAVADLASGAAGRVEVHRLPYVEALEDCQLSLVCRSWDQGIVRVGAPARFECGFTSGTWDNVAGLIEPFAQDGSHGYQWLAGTPGEAALLISRDGSW